MEHSDAAPWVADAIAECESRMWDGRGLKMSDFIRLLEAHQEDDGATETWLKVRWDICEKNRGSDS